MAGCLSRAPAAQGPRMGPRDRPARPLPRGARRRVRIDGHRPRAGPRPDRPHLRRADGRAVAADGTGGDERDKLEAIERRLQQEKADLVRLERGLTARHAAESDDGREAADERDPAATPGAQGRTDPSCGWRTRPAAPPSPAPRTPSLSPAVQRQDEVGPPGAGRRRRPGRADRRLPRLQVQPAHRPRRRVRDRVAGGGHGPALPRRHQRRRDQLRHLRAVAVDPQPVRHGPGHQLRVVGGRHPRRRAEPRRPDLPRRRAGHDRRDPRPVGPRRRRQRPERPQQQLGPQRQHLPRGARRRPRRLRLPRRTPRPVAAAVPARRDRPHRPAAGLHAARPRPRPVGQGPVRRRVGPGGAGRPRRREGRRPGHRLLAAGLVRWAYAEHGVDRRRAASAPSPPPAAPSRRATSTRATSSCSPTRTAPSPAPACTSAAASSSTARARAAASASGRCTTPTMPRVTRGRGASRTVRAGWRGRTSARAVSHGSR